MKVLAFVILYWLLTQKSLKVKATATFEWMIVTYNNSGGSDAQGMNCDYILGQCDHVFRFGMDWLEGNDNATDTPILTNFTRSFCDENVNYFPPKAFINGIYNPITHVFDVWPGGILLKVHIEDDDTPYKEPDLVDEIIYRIVAPVSPSEAKSMPTRAEATGNFTTLTFTWRVYCNENYFGDNCDKFCKPHDDQANGHFVCDPQGDKVCLRGWDEIDKSCLTKVDDCKSNRCGNGADCIDYERSYKCQCKPGFTGTLCETNIDECLLNPCQNGATCEDKTNDYFCRCPSEFVGRNCSIKACANSNPCLNGGTCYGESNCYCSPNFVGAKCQDPMCKVAGCLNGGMCSTDGTCICKPGYTGMRCEIDLCSSIGPFCQNGGFCREGKCHCPEDFAGVACQESLLCDKFKCHGGACSVVRLKDSQMLVPQCQCVEGYSGKNCEIKQNEPQGDSIASGTKPDGHFYLFGVLFVIFVILTLIFLVLTIVLTVLLCRRNKRNNTPNLTSRDEATSDSKIYSTSADTLDSRKRSSRTNLFEYDNCKLHLDSELYMKSVDEISIPE